MYFEDVFWEEQKGCTFLPKPDWIDGKWEGCFGHISVSNLEMTSNLTYVAELHSSSLMGELKPPWV